MEPMGRAMRPKQTLNPTPYTPKPYTLHPTAYTPAPLNLTPLHPTPLNPTPYTPKPQAVTGVRVSVEEPYFGFRPQGF